MRLLAGALGATIFLIVAVLAYNRFVRRRYLVRSAWADIDVQLRKRYDLVPGLVNVVRGYAAHESETLTRVTEMRSLAMRAAGPGEKSRAESGLVETLRSLLMLVEAYPGLRADSHYLAFMAELGEIEDALEHARRYYNAAVLSYNVAIGLFPANLLASAFGFAPELFFELAGSEEARSAGAVTFR